jgi:uncharacterized flavoprotein (TIGR03862 family)
MTDMPQKPKTIAIIGGGPAGLFAAETLAGLGHQVTIYERMASLGRKFLLAGRGGLNLTHSEPLGAFTTRYGQSQTWMKAILAGFTPDDLRAWAEGLGQELFVGSSGRVFPKAMKASPLLRAWLARLSGLGVQVELGAKWEGWTQDGQLAFARRQGQSLEVKADAVLLALGGASWARLGSDGAWVELLAQKGVAIEALVASNCGVTVEWSAHLSERFAGAPLKAVALSCGDMSARGDIVLTKSGLEGGAVYALSPAIRAALAKGPAQITLDLRPDQDVSALAQRLVKAKAGQSLSTALKGQARLSPAAIGLMREASNNQLPNTAMGLARLIKAVPVDVTGLSPIDRAISTAGGIARGALSRDLELKAVPGTFAAGEMLDWDGPTGGYLLQACFASGKHAALGIDAFIHEHNQE